MVGKNTWLNKIKRTFTAIFLPVSKNRRGACRRCGKCCKKTLPNGCIFLKETPGKPAECLIYPIRPPNCRKYPRTKEEQVYGDCGYWFVDEDESSDV